MDHLQVSVLALREVIDRQEHRIEDLMMQRNALAFAFVVVGALFALVVVLCR